MKYLVLFCFLIALAFACSKHAATKYVSGPPTTISGHLRYSSTYTDGPGLWFQVDAASVSAEATAGDSVLLLSDGKGGYIIDGDSVGTSYHRLIDAHTRLLFSLTGKKGCQQGGTGMCYYHPIVDTLGFSPAP